MHFKFNTFKTKLSYLAPHLSNHLFSAIIPSGFDKSLHHYPEQFLLGHDNIYLKHPGPFTSQRDEMFRIYSVMTVFCFNEPPNLLFCNCGSHKSDTGFHRVRSKCHQRNNTKNIRVLILGTATHIKIASFPEAQWGGYLHYIWCVVCVCTHVYTHLISTNYIYFVKCFCETIKPTTAKYR